MKVIKEFTQFGVQGLGVRVEGWFLYDGNFFR